MRNGEHGHATNSLLAFALLFALGLVVVGILSVVMLLPEKPPRVFSPVLPAFTATPTSTGWVGPDGEREYEYLMQGDSYIIGGDDHKIEMFNNPQAHDPTWAELEAFLREDITDQLIYSATFVCVDFAEKLHNNAERVGIRAAIVAVGLLHEPEGHALNAFKTVDRGLVYIDDTGFYEGEAVPCSADKTVQITVGSEYRPQSLFACKGWSYTWESAGMVTEIYVQW